MPTPPPVEAAPDATTLVPLTELAPAIQAASVSRRAFLGFGLALTGALAGAAGIAKLFPVFADDAPAPATTADVKKAADDARQAGNIAWMLTATAFVMLMMPGLALFYGGMVRRKNALATMMQSMAALAVVGGEVGGVCVRRLLTLLVGPMTDVLVRRGGAE